MCHKVWFTKQLEFFNVNIMIKKKREGGQEKTDKENKDQL